MSKKYIFISFIAIALLGVFYLAGLPVFGQTSAPTCDNSSTAPLDSDGGLNYFKKASTVGLLHPAEKDYTPGVHTLTDYCIGSNLREYACGCREGKVECVSYMFDCSISGYVCNDGACARPGTISTPTPTPASGPTSIPVPTSTCKGEGQSCVVNGECCVGLICQSFPYGGYCIDPIAGSITITSPNGGEVWKEGETHDIIWTSTGVSGKVEIWIYRGDCPMGPGGRYLKEYGSAYPINDEGVPASAGKYSWKIPVGLTKMGEFAKAYGWGLDGGENLYIGVFGMNRIQLGGGAEMAAMDFNDNCFKIVSSAEAAPVFPSIRVLSPNGGEKWELGKIHEIKWQVQGDVSKVGIFLYQGERGEIPVGWIGKDISADTGFFRWAISTIEEGNNYKIGVFQYPFEKRRTGDIIHYGPVDFSDGFFSIVGP